MYRGNFFKSVVLIVSSSFLLVGCGGGSSGEISDGIVTIIPSEVPNIPSESSLSITVKDANSDQVVAGVSVEANGLIIGSASETNITDSSGKVTFDLNQSLFSDLNKDGIPDEAKEVTILIGGDTILNRSLNVVVNSYGETNNDVSVIILESVPEGIEIVSEQTNLTTVKPDVIIDGVPMVEITLETDAANSTDQAVPVVQIPLSTNFISDTGVELDTSNLTVQVVEYDLNNEDASSLISGGTSFEIANPSSLATDTGVDVEDIESVAISMMGIISVEISDGINTASAIVSEEPVQITIPLAFGMINPDTGAPIVAGDKVALLSLSENDALWTYEGEYFVTTDEAGKLVIQYEATHFSTFGFGNLKPGECTGFINIIDDYNQPYADVGDFRIQGDFINEAMPYNGEGRLSYIDLVEENLSIIFTPVDGSAGILIESTTVEGTINEGSPEISGVNPCTAGGKTIVFKALIRRIPTIYAPYYIPSMNEGEDGLLTLTLRNAPVDTAVSFSLKVKEENSGDDFTIEEQTYTFAPGETTLTIPYSSVDDVEVEETEYFTIEYFNADNNATFHNNTSRVSVLDDDLHLTDMNYTASEEGNATITFKLNEAIPASFKRSPYILIEAYSTQTTDAIEMLDFDSKTYFSRNYRTNSKYYLSFEQGSDTATVTIPVYDDIDVESNETFLIDISSTQMKIDIDPTHEITITDNDTLPDTNATAYTVEVIRLGTYDNRLEYAQMWEGEVSWVKVTLDKAAITPLSITYTAPGNGAYTLSNTDSETGPLVFDIGDATKYIAVTAKDNDVTNANVDFNITLEANTTLSGPAYQTLTILDNDFDYMYIDGPFSGELATTEGFGIETRFHVTSNFSPLSIDYATIGDNDSVAGTLFYAQGGESYLIGETLFEIDDEVVNPTRDYTATANLAYDSIDTTSPNWVAYIYGSTEGYCKLWNPTLAEFNACAIFERKIRVVDNDKYEFAIEEPGSVHMDIPYGSSSTIETTVPLTLASKNLNRDISFDLQDGATVTLTEDEPRKTFNVIIPATSIDPSIDTSIVNYLRYTVILTMTEESQNALIADGLAYDLNTSAVIDISYSFVDAATN